MVTPGAAAPGLGSSLAASPVTGQGGCGVRFDWGLAGAAAIVGGASIVAVVDVLSFTTTLTVAVERGMAVLPHQWGDASAPVVAREHGATLAVGRSAAGPGDISLSPATVLRAEGVERLVLPSPNGATICAALAGTGATVIGVSLRNAVAAAGWVRRRLSTPAGWGPVAVVAAGERWADGSLRPAVEDLWGAGAFLDALTVGDPFREVALPRGPGRAAMVVGAGAAGREPADAERRGESAEAAGRGESAGAERRGESAEAAGRGESPEAAEGAREMPPWAVVAGSGMSPEAGAALWAYRGVSGRVSAALRECASGLELIAGGFGEDVDVAGRPGSAAVPVLRDGWFRDGAGEAADRPAPAP